MSSVALALRQFRYENRSFWRNPAAAFFTFMFPLIFLVLFPLLFGNADIPFKGGEISGETFYVPAIGVFAIISATYTNLAISLVFAREEGVLKRVRGTPLPASSYMAGRILQAMFMSVVMTVLTVTVGVLLYGVEVPTDTLHLFLVTVLVGAASFSALGIAMGGVVPNADSGPPMVNASILPLMFISDVFVPSSNLPDWLKSVADFFPISHFAEAMIASYLPEGTGPEFEWSHIAIMAVWGVAGTVIATKTFSWEKKR